MNTIFSRYNFHVSGTIFFFIFLGVIFNLRVFAQAHFIANLGQWEQEFNFKLRLNHGAIFFEDDGLTYHLISSHDLEENHGQAAHEGHSHGSTGYRHHAFRQKFLQADRPRISGEQKLDYYQNYFLGRDETRWKSNVPVFEGLFYENIYPGIHIRYHEAGEHLKYDWIVEPGADVSKIQWAYPGADSTWVENNTLIIKTSVGFITEELPAIYTLKNGLQTSVTGGFKKTTDGFGFYLGSYNTQDTLVIDPNVVFASFSGSTGDNWGYTATFDFQGNLYGAGTVFAAGYPITNGAFQTFHANPTTDPQNGFGCDVGISKFNPTGTNLIYSTYLGGSANEQPHSMFVDASGNLYVMGVTSSLNYPTTSGAVQGTFGGGNSLLVNGIPFDNGTDIFISRISATGSNLLGSSYLGGSANDGLNLDAVANYGDQARGEIVVDTDGSVYIASSTLSTNYPRINAAQNNIAGNHDAVISKLNAGLTTLLWSTYFGGPQDDMGYSLKKGTNNVLYICGSTKSNSLTGTAGTINPTYRGGIRDGFIASFNANTGAQINATYVGTNLYDQTFLIDLDKFNNVFVFGQTGSGSYPCTPGAYCNPGAKQFIHKFNSTLSATIFSMTFGKGQNAVDMVPIAFNVDDCQNIMLSGWGGQTNNGFPAGGGNLSGMPISNDAFQKTTDGSDLYFAVFGANATTLKYATFFGGSNSREHVDGGTSRFDPTGTIYQAVCAGCGQYSDFPTTPGAWSRANNSTNCNLGVVKIDFETDLKADFVIDSASIDTSCITFSFNLINKSRNANAYEWLIGNGQTSTATNPTVTFTGLGTYTITLIAKDTLCNISDTAFVTISFTQGTKPLADFNINYVPCDALRTVMIANLSLRANKFIWRFGDGNTATHNVSQHSYANDGTYLITLIAIDTTCGASDTLVKSVSFDNNLTPPEVYITPDTCFFGGIVVRYENDSSWYTYEWNFGGKIDNNKYPTHRFNISGRQKFSLIIHDTLCNKEYLFEFDENVDFIEDRVFIPNAFTPNRDDINEYFYISGNSCLGNATFQILNSFGGIVFETDKPFSVFWDGTINGKPAQQDVYVYVFKSDEFVKRGYIVLFY